MAAFSGSRNRIVIIPAPSAMNEQQQSLLLNSSSRFLPPQGSSRFPTSLPFHCTIFLFSLTLRRVCRSEAIVRHSWVQGRCIVTPVDGVQGGNPGGSEIAEDAVGDRRDDHGIP